MKLFISSLVRGLEAERDAAAAAIRSLGHEPRRAEDFGVSPDSPQIVCRAGVRESDLTILILGARYGAAQRLADRGQCAPASYASPRPYSEPTLTLELPAPNRRGPRSGCGSAARPWRT